MELRFAPLFSGSSGNSLLVGCGEGNILVDAGVSATAILNEMRNLNEQPKSLEAILVTHEHVDHIRSVGALSRRLSLPVFATRGTWLAMKAKIGRMSPRNMRVITPGEDFYVAGMDISCFSIPHDAAEPVGFTIRGAGASISIATDVGEIKDEWLSACEGCDLIMLESNYDEEMLANGAYPQELKRRIVSARGHLCNIDAAAAAAHLVENGTRCVVLGHMSEENNLPELAEHLCRDELSRRGLVADVIAARRGGGTGMFRMSIDLRENPASE